MKKIIVAILLAAVFLSVVPAFAYDPDTTDIYVTTGRVTVYYEDGTVKTVLPAGAVIFVSTIGGPLSFPLGVSYRRYCDREIRTGYIYDMSNMEPVSSDPCVMTASVRGR